MEQDSADWHLVYFRIWLDPPPVPEEEPYDPRTLYERLQEQKQKKDDAFAEATKFGKGEGLFRSMQCDQL